MAIYDNDGTTNFEIVKVYDNDGTTNYPIAKIYDNDGTMNYLLYQNERVLDFTSVKKTTTGSGGSHSVTGGIGTLDVKNKANYGNTYGTAEITFDDVVGYSTLIFDWSTEFYGDEAGGNDSITLYINGEKKRNWGHYWNGNTAYESGTSSFPIEGYTSLTFKIDSETHYNEGKAYISITNCRIE